MGIAEGMEALITRVGRPVVMHQHAREGCTAGLTFDRLAMDRLTLFLRGADELPFRLYALLTAKPVAVIVQPTLRPLPW